MMTAPPVLEEAFEQNLNMCYCGVNLHKKCAIQEKSQLLSEYLVVFANKHTPTQTPHKKPTRTTPLGFH